MPTPRRCRGQRGRAAAVLAVGSALVLAGCGGHATKAAGAAASTGLASSSAPPVTTPAAAPATPTAVASRTTPVVPVPVRTAAAARTPVPVRTTAPAPAPAPSVSRTVHMTNLACGPQGMTFDVVFSDGHVVSQSRGPGPSVPYVDVAGPAPYSGRFTVDDPAVDCP